MPQSNLGHYVGLADSLLAYDNYTLLTKNSVPTDPANPNVFSVLGYQARGLGVSSPSLSQTLFLLPFQLMGQRFFNSWKSSL